MLTSDKNFILLQPAYVVQNKLKINKQAQYTFSLLDAAVLFSVWQYFIAYSDTKVKLYMQLKLINS